MALVGTYIHKETKPSETETVEYEMTHPEYPSDHPLFEKSGTTETISDAKMEEITQVYDDVYLIVRAASTHQKVGVDGLKSLYVSAMISLYQDKQHKEEDFFNELFQNIIDIRIESLDKLKPYNNSFDFAYAKLKEMDNFKQLKDS